MRRLAFKKKPAPRAAAKPSGPGWTYPAAGLVLLPVAAASYVAAASMVRDLSAGRFPAMPVLAGAAAYAVCQLVFQKPMRVYVFGHEMTHALAAWLSGFRVKSMSVSAKGGEVVLTGSNAAVALAPYCVPLYTLAAAGLFYGLRKFTPYAPPWTWLAFATGFTFAFHVALTAHALAQNQPDLKQAGVFLSMTLILLANAVAFVLLAKLLFPSGVSLKSWGAELAATALLFYDRVLRGAGWAAEKAWSALRGADWPGLWENAKSLGGRA